MCGFYAALFGATPIELVIASVTAVIMPFIYKLDLEIKIRNIRVEHSYRSFQRCHYHYDSKVFRSDARIGISIVGLMRSWNRAITNAIRDTLL